MPARGFAQFRVSIRAAVRGLWSGKWDGDDFLADMVSVIDRGFTGAWRAGAAECGINPIDYSPEEKAALQTVILGQYPHLVNFMLAIEAGSKANGGKLMPLMRRAEMWIGRYNEVLSQARTMACGDEKLTWTLGPTEHCISCAKLSGKTKRATYWQKVRAIGVYPKSPSLECKGFKCQCQLLRSEAPVSKGPLPSI